MTTIYAEFIFTRSDVPLDAVKGFQLQSLVACSSLILDLHPVQQKTKSEFRILVSSPIASVQECKMESRCVFICVH